MDYFHALKVFFLPFVVIRGMIVLGHWATWWGPSVIGLGLSTWMNVIMNRWARIDLSVRTRRVEFRQEAAKFEHQ